MKNTIDNFEVLCNTKHKHDIKVKFIIPISRDKKWWEFWRKSHKKTIIEIMDNYKEDISIPNDIYIPENKSNKI